MCELSEDEGEDDGKEKRLKDEPSGTEDGLFVLSEEVATNQKVKEVAVLPNAGEIEPGPSRRGLESGDFVACGNGKKECGEFSDRLIFETNRRWLVQPFLNGRTSR